jgi:hypothetical protein
MPGPELEPVTSAQPPWPSQAKQHVRDQPTVIPDGFEKLARIAQLVADGQIELPFDLPPEQLTLVIDSVRERLRQHLMRHIARCIAFDIMSNGKHKDRKPQK